MGLHISIDEYYDCIMEFSKNAPQMLIESYWEHYEKMCKEVLSSRNIANEKRFIYDWINVMVFLKGGAMDMTKLNCLDNNNSYTDIFKELGINEIPEYKGDPERFAQNMKPFSLLKNEDIKYSSGTKQALIDHRK